MLGTAPHPQPDRSFPDAALARVRVAIELAALHLETGVKHRLVRAAACATIGGESIRGVVALPGPFRPLCFAVLLAVFVVGAGIARAEMTEADKEGMQIFAACLDEAGNDEDSCLEKLGRYAWYPREEAVCEIIGARVEEVLELGGAPKYRDLFMNERCARLDLPHGKTAAAAGATRIGNENYAICGVEGSSSRLPQCADVVVRHLWYPVSSVYCKSTVMRLRSGERSPIYAYWSLLFETERCRRLGGTYYKPDEKP